MMQSSWVDRLFERLTIRYGVAFSRVYEGLDIDAVKDDWEEVLKGVDVEGIRYALSALPAERPPNAMQFRDLCKSAPRVVTPLKLPEPQAPADINRVRELVSKLRLSNGWRAPSVATSGDKQGEET